MPKCHARKTISEEWIIIIIIKNWGNIRINIVVRCRLMECSTLEATYVLYYSSAGVIFQGICSSMMPMADIHNRNWNMLECNE